MKILLLLLFSLLVGCSGGGETPFQGEVQEEPAGPSGSMVRWYALQEGNLVEIGELEDARGKTFRSWTTQERPVEFLETEDHLYLAVNGYGLIESLFTETEQLFYRPDLFRGRTIGSLAFQDGIILIHLYRNTLFSDDQVSSPPLSIVSYVPGSEAIHRHPLFFQEEHPEWEAVDILFGDDWHIAWKKTGPEKNDFRYSIYHPGGFEESEITMTEFLTARKPLEFESAPDSLQALAAYVFDDTDNTAFEFQLSAPDALCSISYLHGSFEAVKRGDSLIEIVPVFQSEAHMWLMKGEGELFWEGSEIHHGQLPVLPEGFTYINFWTDNNILMAIWEERSQFQVGRSGIVTIQVGCR